MKQLKYLLLGLCTLLFACNGDEIQPDPTGNTNQNANTNVTSGVSELHNANLNQIAQRLEIPHLKEGNNLFVAHTLTDGRVNYCMEYDCTLLASRWTAYQWYGGFSSSNNGWDRRRWKQGETFNGYGGDSDPFQPDPLIPSAYQTTLKDHSSNGHDRGHMLGSADRLNTKEANGQTFYLSNMHPQLAGFNQRGIWYNLEIKLRDQYDTPTFRDTLYVVKGGTIDNKQYSMRKGAGKSLVVPKYFYMALLCKIPGTKSGYKAIAFWMEHKDNNDVKFKDYAITIDELERRTGIDFFCNLPDEVEKSVEGSLSLAAWGIK